MTHFWFLVQCVDPGEGHFTFFELSLFFALKMLNFRYSIFAKIFFYYKIIVYEGNLSDFEVL